MGIGWTLQGVDAAGPARNPAKSSSGRVVLGAASALTVLWVASLKCV
jgi:hypothetical protein